MPWRDVEEVLLDMDGTLLDLAFDTHFWTQLLPQRFGAARGLTAAEAMAELQPIFARTRGSLDWYCTDFWSRQTGLDVAALKREVAHGVQLLPETTAVLERLCEDRKRLWLVTNAHPETLAIKLERAPIADYFERIVSSHSLRAPKEQPAFWQRLHGRHPFEPDAALFVDDSMPVLEAARDFGIAHVVAAAWPDRSQPPRTHDGFPTVRTLDELFTAVQSKGPASGGDGSV
ncbi:GMP/IMP nucleotidase [Algiphilus aromaticivorans]|uniref:GMP/IMP nucleotidase n=1 Tax=Algiphilus aromaticivorans TaxID=382454 RepID=UPI001E498B17|nr:GMP/IMP nucleotidase [Algiphilus aromaticivorans]